MTAAAAGQDATVPQQLVILGGSGFVGHHLLPRLLRDGHRVRLLSRRAGQHRDLAVLPGLQLHSVDPYDGAQLRRQLEGADAVINLIGVLNARSLAGFRRVHVELTGGLIEACRAVGVPRLHQMSTLKAGQGLSHYLKSRGEAEVLVKASGLHWTIYQPSVIFGAGDGLVSRFHALLRRLPMLPLARPQARLAPTYVGDVVEAISRRVARGPYAAPRSFELYGAQVLSLIEIVRQIRDAAGLRTPVVGLPDSLGRLQAQLGELLPGTPISRDNFRTLRTDSVGKLDGYAALGISPQAFGPWPGRLLGPAPRQPRLDQLRRQRRQE